MVDEHAHVAEIDLGDVLVSAYSHLVNEVKSSKRDEGLPVAVDSHQ